MRSRISHGVTRPAVCTIDALQLKLTPASATVLFLVMILIPSVIHAAPSGEADNQWPPVNSQELTMKDCLQSPGAPAIILYHEETWNDARNTADFYFRIKVFTKPGEDYGKIEIPYSPALIRVSEIRGRTIHSDGQILDFDGEIYDREIIKSGRVKLREKAFVLPGVQPGSVLEYAYRLSGVKDFSGYGVSPSASGVHAVHSAEWNIQQDAFMMRGKFLIIPFPGWKLEWSKMGMFDLPSLQKRPQGDFVYEVLNVPPISKEEFMPPEGALRAAVDFYYITSDQSLPNSRVYWEALAYERGKNFDYLKHPGGVIKKEVARIVASGDSADIKARKIYARVAQIRNLDTEPEKTAKEERKQGLKENNSLEDILKRGYARGNEINYLFVALAQAAGLDADIAKVRDRKVGYFNLNDLDPSQADATVVRVKVEEKDVFIDPATKFCPYGLLPWYESNTGGFVASQRHPEIINIPELAPTVALRRRDASVSQDAHGNLSGQVKVTLTGQEAFLKRIRERNNDATQRRKDVEDEVKGWLPSGSTVNLMNHPAWNETSDTLNLEFTIKVPGFALQQGRHLILPVHVIETNRTYPFQPLERKYPIDLKYPYEDLDEITIRIPPDYKVEALPEDLHTTRTYGSYSVTYHSSGNQIEVTRHVVVNKSVFGVNAYPDLRLFFTSMRVGDRQQALLGEVQNDPHQN
ncbi:MAG TPA: DUF3857 domain-containing protein [Terriglobia bacterium]|nr:DUF3857 domain-containing protein [Terriglobia bacterium]